VETEIQGLKPSEPKQRKRKARDATMRVGASGIELVKRGAARYDFSDPYHITIELSSKEFALAFVGLELGINIVFALLYLARPGCIANARPGSFSDAFFFTLLTNAVVRLGAVLLEESAEGHPLRRLHDLALSNATLSLFPLTWTLMHEIDENSPLAAYDAARFQEDDARLILTIEARHHAIGAAVYDLRDYTADEVLFGMHYAEAVTIDDQLRPVADLSRLSLVEPD
jgi:Inward rectifier potassium channel C-terminal domain